jgi:tetratricopeptide (TPR) repeat protein
MSSPADSKSNTAASALSAVRNIAIAALVLGSIFFAYSRYVTNSKALKELSRKASELIQHDSARDYAQAAKLLDDALAIRPKDSYAVSARATVAAIRWLELGVDAEAKVAQDLSAQADALELNTKERFQADGLVAIAKGDPADAEKKLMLLTERNITPAEVIAPLGMARARQGRLEMSKNDFKQAAEREWRTPRYFGLYGDAFYDAGDFTSAASTYQKALDVNPTHLRSLIGRSRADAGRHENAEQAAQTIADVLGRTDELSPVMKARALAAKSEILAADGKFAESEAAAQEAVAAEVKGDIAAAYAHYDLGLALAHQKKAGALEAIQGAIALFPPVARFYFQGALALADAGNVAAGEALFDAYAKSYKQNDAFHLARGDFHRASGALDKALVSYDAAIAENNLNADAYFKKGYTLQLQATQPKADKKKLFNAARESYEKAVGIREKFPEVYRQMGLIYLDNNPRSTEATDNFGKALLFYKEQHAPKDVFEEFISEVEAKYTKANLKVNAVAWRKEASVYAK